MELQNKQITITGIDAKAINNSTLTTIIADRDKYQMWSNKKDGSLTKAMEQWNKFGFKIGDTVEVAFSAEPQSFINEQGKEINFERKTIMYFKEIDENTPATQQVQQNATQTQQDRYSNEYIDKIVEKVKELEAKINSLEAKNIKDVIEDDIPTIKNNNDDVKLEDIPF